MIQTFLTKFHFVFSNYKPAVSTVMHRVDFVDMTFQHFFRRHFDFRGIRYTAACLLQCRVFLFLLILLNIFNIFELNRFLVSFSKVILTKVSNFFLSFKWSFLPTWHLIIKSSSSFFNAVVSASSFPISTIYITTIINYNNNNKKNAFNSTETVEQC